MFSLRGGKLRLLTKEFTGPNGIALSPDEKWLYVANWDDHQKVVMRYELRPDATVGEGRLFFDMTSAPGEDALDGMKVDVDGRVYCTGPGGTWVFAPDGTRLGIIRTPEIPANLAFGGPDLRTLFFTARTSVYSLRVKVPGQPHPWYRVRGRPAAPPAG